jgi:RNA polymerase sigma-70 factor (ECF subfamily)
VSETEALFDIVDDAPGPARIVEARSDVAALRLALMELPPRRRHIVFAACMDEIPHQEIAQRLGVSVRTIQFELKQAMTYCAGRLDRTIPRRLAPHRHSDGRGALSLWDSASPDAGYGGSAQVRRG